MSNFPSPDIHMLSESIQVSLETVDELLLGKS